MSLTMVRSSEPDVRVLRPLVTASDHTASDQPDAVGRVGGDDPVAVALVTSGDADRRAAVTRLVESHVSLVEILVCERLRTVPRHVDRSDLMSAGMFALVLAAAAFDESRGVPFTSFAAFRIRGALVDELRGMDWASRSVRARLRDADAARHSLESSLGRCPTEAEVAGALGVGVRELAALHADAARGTVISLQGCTPDAVHDVLPDPGHGPEALLLQREQLGYLHDAVDALPERLQFVVRAYFFQDRPMHEIAAELSVTQSRVSQLCAEATALIRDGLNAQLDPEALAPLARSGRAAATRARYYDAVATRSTVAGRLARSASDGRIRQQPATVPATRSRIA